MKIMLVLFLFFGLISAVDNPGTYAITNDYLQAHFLTQKQNGINSLLQNPGLQRFYHEYYSRPQDTQALQIQELIDRIRDNTKLVAGHSYPYSNQISVDPNIVARLVNQVPQASLLDNIRYETERLAAMDRAAAQRRANYQNQYYAATHHNPYAESVRLRNSMSALEDMLHDSRLNRTPEHTYSRPFEKGGNMDKTLQKIQKMEHDVHEPLPPMKPNEAEIAAINRLSQQMQEISTRIHEHSVDHLHQHAHAQDVLLERLSVLIRQMSNAVRPDGLKNFLETVHMLIHKHHLHDHKFLNTLETEMMQAAASGQPLAISNPIEKETETTPVVETATQTLARPVDTVTNAAHTVTDPVANAVPTAVTDVVKHPVDTVTNAVPTAVTDDAKHPVDTVTNAAHTVTDPVANAVPAAVTDVAKNSVDTVTNPAHTVTEPVGNATATTQEALATSAAIEQKGREMIANSKELDYRADIVAQRSTISKNDKDELVDAIKTRLNAPPAQVHVLGAERPRE